MISTVTVPFVAVALVGFGLALLQLLLFFVSLWMIFLILIQRGKGGGLTAAFGGGGGDSAFGAKAGDAFTKITIVTALVWITLCMITIAAFNPPDSPDNPFAANNEIETVENQGASGGMSAVGDADSEEVDSGEETTADAASDNESTAADDEGGEAEDSDSTPGDEAESTAP